MSGWHGPFARALADIARDDFSAMEAYWTDPAATARFDAEIAANRAQVHAAIDRGMAPLKEKQERRWAEEAVAAQRENG